MGSRGSVIPLFHDCIRRGQSLPITVPHMSRFLMTLDQSVDLVLHAMTRAQGGEIFVRKAPASTVHDLATTMLKKYSNGCATESLKIIGIRSGEKLHEILVNEYEMQRSSEDDTYYTIYPEYSRASTTSIHPPGTEYTSENTERLSTYESISALLDSMGFAEEYI